MTKTAPRTAALIVAAGRGTRAGGGLPKQYRQIGGRPVLARTLTAFVSHPRIERVQVVIHSDDRALYDAHVQTDAKLLSPVNGGDSRAESVLEGLRALTEQGGIDNVLIHDAARPFVSNDMIDRVVDALGHAEGALAMLPAVDAMRHVDAKGRIGSDVSRAGICRAQTPQGFHLTRLLDAFMEAQGKEALADYPDDAAIAFAYGLDVVAVHGEAANFKLTMPEDFAMAERLLTVPDVRHGQGFDVHAFCEGNYVILCGISVPHDKALSGHSDADVGLHALTDAILGGAAMGDIGQHFPPSDPQWKGADSAQFLSHAVALVREAGFTLSNLDVTLMCERPKIGPHALAMRGRIAEICALDVARVSVKATTTERLGFCGREEGIAALASACLIGGVA